MDTLVSNQDKIVETVVWGPKKSKYSSDRIKEAYARAKMAREQQVAAKNLVVASITEDNLDEVASVVPPPVVAKIAVVASKFPVQEQKHIAVVMFRAICSAGVTLAKYKLVPGLPEVIRQVPIEKKKRRENLKFTIGDYPVLRNPETFEESAAIFNNSNYEAAKDYRQYMDLTAMKKNVPTLALTSEDLRTPFKRDMFREMKPAKNTANTGEIIRNYVNKWLKLIPPGEPLKVLWGDSGKLVVSCARSLHPSSSVCFVSTTDYPLHYYDKYKAYVNSGPRKDRISRLDYPGTMKEYIESGGIEGYHVLSNYVPFDVQKWGSLSHFFVCRSEEIESKKKRVMVPSGMPPKVMARYAEFAMFKNVQDMANVELYDPVSGITYNYHHHEVWPDKFLPGVVGIPLRTLIHARSGAMSSSRLSMVVGVGHRNFPEMGVPEVFVPLTIPASTVDIPKCFTFNAEEVAYIPYMGLLPGIADKSVSSMVLVAKQNGQWHIVDADFSNKFVNRYTELMFSGLPVVSPSSYGRYAVPWEAKDVTLLVELAYDDVLEPNDFTISRVAYHGIALCGTRLVYDGYSEFSEVPYNFTSLAASDEKHPWRVRFTKKQAVYYAGFYFQKVSEDMVYCDLSLEDIQGYPPDIREKLRVLCSDDDAYC
jgi:hypothetical protein